MGSERVNNENVLLLLNSAGILVTAGTSKAEVLKAFFAPVFTDKGFQVSVKRDGVHSGKQQRAVDKDQIRDICHVKNNSLPLALKL